MKVSLGASPAQARVFRHGRRISCDGVGVGANGDWGAPPGQARLDLRNAWLFVGAERSESDSSAGPRAAAAPQGEAHRVSQFNRDVRKMLPAAATQSFTDLPVRLLRGDAF